MELKVGTEFNHDGCNHKILDMYFNNGRMWINVVNLDDGSQRAVTTEQLETMLNS